MAASADTADAAEAAEPSRLCLLNVPKYMDKKQLGAFLSSVEGLPPVKSFTKVYQKEMAFVTFEDADAVAAAKPVLAAQRLKGNLLDVQDDTRKKRQRCGDGGEGEERTKKQKLEDNAPDDLGNWLVRRLAREAEAASAAASDAEAGAAAAAALRYPRTVSDVVTSLWEMEYAEQLKRKQTERRKVVVKLWRKTRGVYFTKAKDESRQSGKGGRGKRGGRGGRGGGRGKGALSGACEGSSGRGCTPVLCASMRTPPPATMGVRAQAGKLFGQFRQKRDVSACVEMESHRVPQHTGRIRLLRTVRT